MSTDSSAAAAPADQSGTAAAADQSADSAAAADNAAAAPAQDSAAPADDASQLPATATPLPLLALLGLGSLGAGVVSRFRK